MRTSSKLFCMLSALMALACVQTSSFAAEPVVVGSKSFTEGVVLGEIVTQRLSADGISVSHRPELGGTQILWQSLLAGEIDAYPEYTGTLMKEILAAEGVTDESQLKAKLAKYAVSITERLGFANNYALGMRADRARELGISRISDLAKHPDLPKLQFGFSEEFNERQDGWPGLAAAYKLPDSNVRSLDHMLGYKAIASGKIDVIDLYTTDPEIRLYDLIVLEDDLGYFRTYHAVVLYRTDLKDRVPEAVTAIKALENQIDTPSMVAMNARAKLDRTHESRVAREFLQTTLNMDIPDLPRESRLSRIWRRFWINTAQHLVLVGGSLLVAIALAIPLGIASYRIPKLGQALVGIVGVLQTIPSMAILVFMIPIFGLGVGPAIAALILYSLLPIVRGTLTGLTGISESLKESAVVLGLPSWARLRLVELPLASPSILAGIKTAAVINVGTATIGALIGAGGYGQPILTGIRLMDMGLILQGAVPAAALALLVQWSFDLLERVLVPAGLRIKRS